MRLKWLFSLAAVMTAVIVGADISAQQAPAPQGGGARAGGGGRGGGGFNLPPLLMTTEVPSSNASRSPTTIRARRWAKPCWRA